MLEENEFDCVGDGIGSGIDKTNELKVLAFDEAMVSPDKDNWQASVNCEHEQMLKSGVWKLWITATFLKVLTSLTQHGQ